MSDNMNSDFTEDTQEELPQDFSRRKKKDGDDWWEDRSIGEKVGLGIGIGILIVGGIFLLGLVTMHLWNWLMPQIFNLPRINYWQTWGLLLLSCIFFKNFGSNDSGGRKDRKRKRQLRRYMHDSPPEADPQSV